MCQRLERGLRITVWCSWSKSLTNARLAGFVSGGKRIIILLVDMRRFFPDRVTLLSALSGLLLACSFPSLEYNLLAWFGLVPLFLSVHKRPFKSGFVAGLVFFAVALYWLNIVMTTYGGLPMAGSVVLYLFLCGYLALYWGTATWAAAR